MNIIGISAYYHDAACCLVKDGVVVAAASEERFTRVKNDKRLPVNAFHYCLEAGGLDIVDVDAVAYYESPTKKLARQLWAGRARSSDDDAPWLDAMRPAREICETLGYEGDIKFYEHHQSHAAASYYCSPFEDAAIMTFDAVGEWTSTSYGRGEGSSLTLFEEVEFPDSIGILYSAVTNFLGFRVNNGEYKVMGLAPYGREVFVEQMRSLLQVHAGGGFSLASEYFDFLRGEKMYSPAMIELFGVPPREPESAVEQTHKDLARSLQVVLEEFLLEKARWLRTAVDSENLCMAGGVALNCVANGRLQREGPFRRLYIQPAAGDAGACIGAALLAHTELTGERAQPMEHAYLGPSWSGDEVSDIVEATGLPAIDFRDDEPGLLTAVVDRILDGKVIGWYHGRMEMGPRALGARSILADPRDPQMRDRLNALVKKREGFRPFAPSVLSRAAADHFDLDHPSPFMLEVCEVTSSLDLPAITHVDRSARPQTVSAETSPRYHALIEEMERRCGCPLVVNTSFNVRGEPVVCSPVDALLDMVYSGIDVLVLEDFILDRSIVPQAWHDLVAAWDALVGVGRAGGLPQDVYTFL